MRDFSPWPSVKDYLDFARGQGCTVAMTQATYGGADYAVATISTVDGHAAVEVFVDLDDRLMSTTVARLDRRLRIKSCFFI